MIVRVLVVLSLVVSACSARHASKDNTNDAEPIAECDALSAKITSCFAPGGPAATTVAAERAATMRTALAAKAKDPAARATVRQRCIEATKRLADACH